MTLALLLCLPLAGARAEEGESRPSYELHMSLLENEQSLLVHQQVTYTNDTGRPLRYLMFQVYANMLRRQQSVPFDADETARILTAQNEQRAEALKAAAHDLPAPAPSARGLSRRGRQPAA